MKQRHTIPGAITKFKTRKSLYYEINQAVVSGTLKSTHSASMTPNPKSAAAPAAYFIVTGNTEVGWDTIGGDDLGGDF